MNYTMDTNPTDDVWNDTDPFRVILKTAIAALIKEEGFSIVEPLALESLAEIAQSFISQMGFSSRHNAELANRTVIMVNDVGLALVEAGYPIEPTKAYLEKRLHRPSLIASPQVLTQNSKPKTLQVNSSGPVPAYVHENLPQFPDKHTYIQTAARRLPTTDYQMVREKAATQKKEVESALTKFIAKTGASNYYCPEEDNPINTAFPLIACKPSPLSYIVALLPKDNETTEDFDYKQEQDLPPIEKPKVKKQKVGDGKLQADTQQHTDSNDDMSV